MTHTDRVGMASYISRRHRQLQQRSQDHGRGARLHQRGHNNIQERVHLQATCPLNQRFQTRSRLSGDKAAAMTIPALKMVTMTVPTTCHSLDRDLHQM